MRYGNRERRTPIAALLRVLGATAVALMLLVGAHASASAQGVCTSHAEVTRQLHTKYAEARVALGLADNGGVVEVFSSGDGATWTLVLTMPNGVSCLLASGEAWETIAESVLGPQA